MKISGYNFLARENQELRAQVAELSASKLMFDDIDDYEKSLGFKVNDKVRIGFEMGRLKMPLPSPPQGTKS